MFPPTDNDLSAPSHTDTAGPSHVATAGPSRTFTEGRRPTFFSGSGKSSSDGPLISEPSVRQGNAAWLSVNADRCLRSNRYNRRASSSPSVSPGHPAFSRALFSLSSYAACRSCSQGIHGTRDARAGLTSCSRKRDASGQWPLLRAAADPTYADSGNGRTLRSSWGW